MRTPLAWITDKLFPLPIARLPIVDYVRADGRLRRGDIRIGEDACVLEADGSYDWNSQPIVVTYRGELTDLEAQWQAERDRAARVQAEDDAKMVPWFEARNLTLTPESLARGEELMREYTATTPAGESFTLRIEIEPCCDCGCIACDPRGGKRPDTREGREGR